MGGVGWGWGAVGADPAPRTGPGVDFALTVAGGALTPVALELNGGRCLEACGALEGLWAAPRSGPATEEAAAAPLVETMLRRSARCLMAGKRLLVVGGGGVSKKFVWEAARDYGLQVGGAGAQPGACVEEAARARGRVWGGAALGWGLRPALSGPLHPSPGAEPAAWSSSTPAPRSLFVCFVLF